MHRITIIYLVFVSTLSTIGKCDALTLMAHTKRSCFSNAVIGILLIEDYSDGVIKSDLTYSDGTVIKLQHCALLIVSDLKD